MKDTRARNIASSSRNLLVGNKRRARLNNYAKSFLMRGIGQVFDVMETSPTITKSTTTTSSVNTSYVNNNVQIAGQDSRLRWLGGPYADITKLGILTRSKSVITKSNAAKTTSGLTRVQFVTDAEAVDFCFVESSGLDFNLLVDGKIAARRRPFAFANSGQIRWVKADFGNNTVTYAMDHSPAVTNGGTGYVVNDIITLDGGPSASGGTPTKLRVSQVTGGVITNVAIEDPGSYTALSVGAFSQASTTGSGTGVVVTTSIFAKRNTTRRMRKWEMIVRGNLDSFLGLVLPLGCTILNSAPSNQTPSILFVGDSISAGTYASFAGCGISDTVSQMLGLWDNMSLQAQGGTGWNTDNNPALALRWSSSQRIADIVAANPDIVVFIGSQNDASGTALSTAITSTLNTLQSSLPDTLFVGIGNIMGDSTTLAASIAAGWSAVSDTSRAVFVDNHSPNKWIPTAYISNWQSQGDGAHPHADAVNWFAFLAAHSIADAILTMALAD